MLYQAVMLLYLNDHGLSPSPSSPKYLCTYALISCCYAPIPGVPLTTRQPSETYEYRVLRYHTHMSHISRPISIYFSYKEPFSYNILQEFDVQLFYTFTCQNILKLDCYNIFYKMLLKATTRPSSYSRHRRSAVFSCT